MKNILARGGIEFIAVVLGITISFWLDNKKEEWDNSKVEIKIETPINKPPILGVPVFFLWFSSKYLFMVSPEFLFIRKFMNFFPSKTTNKKLIIPAKIDLKNTEKTPKDNP